MYLSAHLLEYHRHGHFLWESNKHLHVLFVFTICLQDEAFDASLREALITTLVGALKAQIHENDATQMMAASILLLRKGAKLKVHTGHFYI